MCDPITASVLIGASGAMSAYGQYQQGQEAKAAANYNASLQENEAIRVENEALSAQTEERMKARMMSSSQRAAAASRGVNVDFGTALKLQEDTELMGELEGMRISEQASEQATALRDTATITRAQGKAAARQGTIGAFTTLLGSAASIGALNAAPAAAGGGTTVNPKWYTYGPRYGG